MTNDKTAWTQLKQAARLRTIVLLQGMIQRLQRLIDRLGSPEDDKQTIADAAPPLFPALQAWLRSLGQGGLRGLRARLPIAWNRRLSDGALTGMVVVTIALLTGVMITLVTTTPRGSQPAQIATNPEPPSTTAPMTAPTTAPTTAPMPAPMAAPTTAPMAAPITAPTTAPTTAPSPSSLPSPKQLPSPEPSPESSPESSPAAAASPSPSMSPVRSPVSTELEQPKSSPTQPSPSAGTDSTDPAMSSELTGSTIAVAPSQSLIASIQTQLTSAIAALAPDTNRLIQFLDPDYAASRLRVQIHDRWYALEFTQQDQIAEALWEQATDLDFSDLDLVDAQGATIARSPVVGDRMIILKRQIPTSS